MLQAGMSPDCVSSSVSSRPGQHVLGQRRSARTRCCLYLLINSGQPALMATEVTIPGLLCTGWTYTDFVKCNNRHWRLRSQECLLFWESSAVIDAHLPGAGWRRGWRGPPGRSPGGCGRLALQDRAGAKVRQQHVPAVRHQQVS